MADAAANDVWSTLSHGLDIYGNLQTEKIRASTPPPPNPSPGAFGAYPQAQTKPSSDGTSAPMSLGSPLSLGLGIGPNAVLLGIAAFLVFVLVMLRR